MTSAGDANANATPAETLSCVVDAGVPRSVPHPRAQGDHTAAITSGIPSGARVASLANQVVDLTVAAYWMWTIDTGLAVSSELATEVHQPNPAVPMELLSVHPADRDVVRDALQTGLYSDDGFDLVHRCLSKTGSVRSVRSRGRGLTNSEGMLIAAFGSMQDLTQVEAMAAELARARDLFRAEMDDSAPHFTIGVDTTGLVTLFDSGAQTVFGQDEDSMLGQPLPEDMLRLDGRPGHLSTVEQFRYSAAGKAGTGRVWIFLSANGQRSQARVRVSTRVDSRGEVYGFVIHGVDVSRRLPGVAKQTVDEAVFEELFDYAPNGIVLCDVSTPGEARILRANRALCRITGYTDRSC